MEIRYSTRNIGSYGCTDCHQHYFVHGTRTHLYVRQQSPVRLFLSGLFFEKMAGCNFAYFMQ